MYCKFKFFQCESTQHVVKHESSTKLKQRMCCVCTYLCVGIRETRAESCDKNDIFQVTANDVCIFICLQGIPLTLFNDLKRFWLLFYCLIKLLALSLRMIGLSCIACVGCHLVEHSIVQYVWWQLWISEWKLLAQNEQVYLIMTIIGVRHWENLDRLIWKRLFEWTVFERCLFSMQSKFVRLVESIHI